MTRRIDVALTLTLLAVLSLACAQGMQRSGGATDQNELTTAEIASANVSTLYDLIHRLRPRWLGVRAPRGFATETEVVVFMNRALLGGVDELRRLGTDVAAWIEYVPGAAAQARLPAIGNRHVEGAIVVHTTERTP